MSVSHKIVYKCDEVDTLVTYPHIHWEKKYSSRLLAMEKII
jgi:hypothetical protein